MAGVVIPSFFFFPIYLIITQDNLMKWYRETTLGSSDLLPTNIKANLPAKVPLLAVIAISKEPWHKLSLSLKVVPKKFFVKENEVSTPEIDLEAIKFLFRLIFDKKYLMTFFKKEL